MALPGKRRTRSSKRSRASHFALKTIALTRCDHCHKMKLPHRACPHCGWYRGREVVHATTKLEKRQRAKTKEAKQSKEQDAKDA